MLTQQILDIHTQEMLLVPVPAMDKEPTCLRSPPHHLLLPWPLWGSGPSLDAGLVQAGGMVGWTGSVEGGHKGVWDFDRGFPNQGEGWNGLVGGLITPP